MSKSLFARKSIFAKLLAKENIHVVLDKVDTASFDTMNRVLRIPYWDGMTSNIYDMLVGHEVSHALHTPNDGWMEFIHSGYRGQPKSLLKDFMNIVEDVRIERIMGVRFPGLEKKFSIGWGEVLQNQYWGDVQKNINNRGFMDRLNAKAKFREHLNVDFTDEEKVLFDKCYKTETFEDVLELTKEMVDYELKNREKAKARKALLEQMIVDMLPSGDFEDELEEQDDEDFTGDKMEVDLTDNMVKLGSDEEEDEEEKSSAKMNFDGDGYMDEISEPSDDEELDGEEEEKPLESPWSVNIHNVWINKNIISDESVVLNVLDKNGFDQVAVTYDQRVFSWPVSNTRYKNWQRNNKKLYMAMYREFERRRAASSYVRSKSNDTGSIDTKKLHQYKFNDRIFKVTHELMEGQSHGLTMLIDFSMSMQKVIDRVLKETLILVNFCKVAGLPYEVWGFTSGNDRHVSKSVHDNYLTFHKCNFVQLTSSKMSKAEKLESEARMLNHNADMHMSFTPLLESLILAGYVAKKMKLENNLDKVSLVALTDGDGRIPRQYMESREAINAEKATFLFDGDVVPITNNYEKSHGYVDVNRIVSNSILEFFKNRFDMKLINYHIVENGSSPYNVIGRSLLDDEETRLRKDGALGLDYTPVQRYVFDKTILLNMKKQGIYTPPAEVKSTATGNAILRNRSADARATKIIAKNFMETIA